MTKERLRNYKNIRREVTQLQELICQLRVDIAAPRSQQLTGMPHGSSRAGSAIETAVERLVELEDLYTAKLKTLVDEQLAVEAAISSLEPAERQLMRARYIEGRKWEEVCVLIGYSWQQTHRLHARALARLCEADK